MFPSVRNEIFRKISQALIHTDCLNWEDDLILAKGPYLTSLQSLEIW